MIFVIYSIIFHSLEPEHLAGLIVVADDYLRGKRKSRIPFSDRSHPSTVKAALVTAWALVYLT